MDEEFKKAIAGLTNNHVGKHLLYNLRTLIIDNYNPSHPDDTDQLESKLEEYLKSNSDTSNIGSDYFRAEINIGASNIFSLVNTISKKFPGSKVFTISARAKYACDNVFSPQDGYSVPHIEGIDESMLFDKHFATYCNNFWFKEKTLDNFLDDDNFNKYFPLVGICENCGDSGELTSKHNRITFEDSFIDFIEFRRKTDGPAFDKLTDVLFYGITASNYSLRKLGDVWGAMLVLKSPPKKPSRVMRKHKTNKNKRKSSVSSKQKYVLSCSDEANISYMTESEFSLAEKFVQTTLFSKSKSSKTNVCFLKGKGIPVTESTPFETLLAYATFVHASKYFDAKSIPKIDQGLDNNFLNPRSRTNISTNISDQYRVLASTARYNGRPFEMQIKYSEDYVKENTKGDNISPVSHKSYEVKREFAKRERWTTAHHLVLNTIKKLFKGETYD